MWNWSVDEKTFKKEHPEEYRLWCLTQLINYGLDGEKLDRREVKHAWPKLKNRIDRYARVLFEYLLFDRLNPPSKDSPIIISPYEKIMVQKCPMCRYDEALESGDIALTSNS